MNKKAGSRFIFILFLIAVLVASSYFLYLKFSDLYAKPVRFITQNKTKLRQSQSFSGQFQFYPNMRFDKRKLTYSIDETCSEEKKENVEKALQRLENETNLLKFYLTEGEPDIFAECDESKEEVLPGKYFIAGEGGPTSMINTSRFYVIQNGKIFLFYKKSECKNYNVELHELLHVFGFKHSQNKNSIMYNTSFCDQVLNNDIVGELKRLYSIESLPDLAFTDITASKKGIYLNFNLSIKNTGLSKAENTTLYLYSENKDIDNFNFKDIDYGEGKIFEAENIRLPSRNIEKLIFKVSCLGKELSLENNEIKLKLPSTS